MGRACWWAAEGIREVQELPPISSTIFNDFFHVLDDFAKSADGLLKSDLWVGCRGDPGASIFQTSFDDFFYVFNEFVNNIDGLLKLDLWVGCREDPEGVGDKRSPLFSNQFLMTFLTFWTTL